MLTVAAAAAFVSTSAQAAWHRGYVISAYEHPLWKGTDIAGAPDSNCPHGSNEGVDWARALKTPWRTDAEVAALTGPGKIDFGSPTRNRGPKPNQNVFRDPTLVKDPGWKMVPGDKAWGFNLDGDESTGGFNTPDGRIKGVDNKVYRIFGCVNFTREGDANRYDIDEMRGGAYTLLVVLSGEGKDPMNDPNVKVGIYQAKEQIVKDTKGEVALDYTYRIDPDPRFMSVIDAKSVNGVITPKRPLERLPLRDVYARPTFIWEMELLKPQIEIKMKEDGTLDGLIGGYRDWRQYYIGWAMGSTINEVATNIELPALWYALEREADYKPDPASPKNTHISAAFRFDAVPAFVMTPETKEEVKVAQIFTGTPVWAVTPRSAHVAKIRTFGGDANLQLEGGAAAWPLTLAEFEAKYPGVSLYPAPPQQPSPQARRALSALLGIGQTPAAPPAGAGPQQPTATSQQTP